MVAGCPLCESHGGLPVYQGPRFRLIRTEEGGFPAFYRLVWGDHVAEFTDLSPADRQLCMEAVACVEATLREHLKPTKVNLATLGNMVAHLHWHVIARFEWDSHFPGPVWAAAQREALPQRVQDIEALRPTLERELARKLGRIGPK